MRTPVSTPLNTSVSTPVSTPPRNFRIIRRMVLEVLNMRMTRFYMHATQSFHVSAVFAKLSWTRCTSSLEWCSWTIVLPVQLNARIFFFFLVHKQVFGLVIQILRNLALSRFHSHLSLQASRQSYRRAHVSMTQVNVWLKKFLLKVFLLPSHARGARLHA